MLSEEIKHRINHELNLKDSLNEIDLFGTKLLKKDGRHSARKDEAIRIKNIVECMNDETSELGRQLRDSYENTFHKTVASVKLAGTNKDHFDFVIVHTDGTSFNVEEKHTNQKLSDKALLNYKPWKYSVQVLNGVGNKFIIGQKYAEHWYKNIICGLESKWGEMLGVDQEDVPSIPDYETWAQDAFRCGDPKTEFVKFIKSHCRLKYGSRESFTGSKNTPDLRSVCLPTFTLTDTEKSVLLEQINNKIQEVMEQKDCYLTTTGDPTGDPENFHWSPKVIPPLMTKITLEHQKDILIHLTDDNNDFNFTAICRWGKGIGFTNIRIDVR
jgi:hypothetical protein